MEFLQIDCKPDQIVAKVHVVDCHLCPSHSLSYSIHTVVNVETQGVAQTRTVSLQVKLANLQPIVVVVVDEMVEVQLHARQAE